MDLVHKIHKIEALIAGAKSDGERQAAEFAKQRLQDKMAAQPIEYTIRLDSLWKKKLFLAICSKHGFHNYRYTRQKRTTTMVRVPKFFMDSVLWPEYGRYASMLDELTHEILVELISQIHQVKDEDETVIAGELSAMDQKGGEA